MLIPHRIRYFHAFQDKFDGKKTFIILKLKVLSTSYWASQFHCLRHTSCNTSISPSHSPNCHLLAIKIVPKAPHSSGESKLWFLARCFSLSYSLFSVLSFFNSLILVLLWPTSASFSTLEIDKKASHFHVDVLQYCRWFVLFLQMQFSSWNRYCDAMSRIEWVGMPSCLHAKQ